MITASFDDSVTMNNGSIVGLPNSSSDEEDSTDTLIRAGDALCRSLMMQEQEQAQQQDKITGAIRPTNDDSIAISPHPPIPPTAAATAATPQEQQEADALEEMDKTTIAVLSQHSSAEEEHQQQQQQKKLHHGDKILDDKKAAAKQQKEDEAYTQSTLTEVETKRTPSPTSYTNNYTNNSSEAATIGGCGGGAAAGHEEEENEDEETSSNNSTSDEETSSTGVGGQEMSLEERVHELETKLATLSRILQQQQKLSVRNLLNRSPTGSQRNLNSSHGSLSLGPPTRLPTLPLMEETTTSTQQMQTMDGNYYYNNTNQPPPQQQVHPTGAPDSPPTIQARLTQKGMIPYLDSPAAIDDSPPRQRSLHQRKRLSFHLLYDGNEDNLALADDDLNIHNNMNENINDSKNNTNVVITTSAATNTSNTTTTTTLVHPTHTATILPAMNGVGGDDDGNNNNNKAHIDTIATEQEDETATASPSSHHSTTTHPSLSSTKSQGSKSPTKGKTSLAEVAARVVDAQGNTTDDNINKRNKSSSGSASGTNSNSHHKETITELSSNHSRSMDGSRSSSNSKKQQPTTPTRNSKSTLQNEQQHPTTSPIVSPLDSRGGGGRVKAAILPPLSLSKDRRSKWLDHLNSFQESNHDVDRQMQEFIKVPMAVELTLWSGLLICVDSFLYVCTILPIRFVWSCVLLSLHNFFRWTKKPAGAYQFHRRHMYQLIQVGIIFLVYQYILLPISIGKLYHWIRGQAMMKLYVVIAMVEIFDRLMCSLGQDCLDSLYWNTTRRPRSSRMFISVSVVIVYTAVHSLILFIHVATLNVAMNSADEALLALLIGGNFAEIKSTVFKKYNKASLFKIVTGDICERFKLALFLGLILLLNYCQGMDSRKLSDYRRIALIVWMSELLCDWLKHAFITKFNFIASNVYPEYGLLLAGDVTGIGHEGVNLDHSHAVVKRLGFAQMPLVCVTARLVREAAKYMFLRIDSQTVPFLVIVLASAGCWILLLSFKIFLGAYLQRSSLSKLYAAPELSQTPLKAKRE